VQSFRQQFRLEGLLKIHEETRHQWIKNISPKEREVSLSPPRVIISSC
jgi:hypothetical protein